MSPRKPIRHDVRSVELMTVVKVQNLRGAGVDMSDPVRLVESFWDLDGNKLFEIDIAAGTADEGNQP